MKTKKIFTVVLLLIMALLVYAPETYAQNKTIKKPGSGTTETAKPTPSKKTQQQTPSASQPTQSTQQPSSTSRPSNGYINGHEYVDLGLSVKWATCNVGATSPSDYGNYYAWGETRTKSNYTSDNCTTWEKDMGDIAGNANYDAARANWGGIWRMPTEEEIEELINKCKWTWTTQGGHNGYKITGPNGNSIFLPAAGCRYGTSLNDAGEYGYYWSSSPDGSGTRSADDLNFSSGGFRRGWDGRDGGRSVRPVSE